MFRRDDYLAAGLKVLPNVHGERATRWTITVGLALQLLITLLLVPLGLGGEVYLVGASILGGVMLGWGVIGLRRSGDDAWARRLFVMSVIYLPLLFTLFIPQG